MSLAAVKRRSHEPSRWGPKGAQITKTVGHLLGPTALHYLIFYTENWPKQIAALVQKQDRKLLDSVIDSGGGEIMTLISKNLKFGGRVVCYGM